ncbi:hypothetical protein ACLB1G_03360 [Oxalobacteraceae bacterium A2-2]
MSVSSLQQAPAAGLCPRTNTQASAVVDQGIVVQESFNTVCAVEYLKSNNVNPDVIERVLLHPEQRRKPAW